MDFTLDTHLQKFKPVEMNLPRSYSNPANKFSNNDMLFSPNSQTNPMQDSQTFFCNFKPAYQIMQMPQTGQVNPSYNNLRNLDGIQNWSQIDPSYSDFNNLWQGQLWNEVNPFDNNINRITPTTKGLIEGIKNSRIFSSSDKKKIAELPELTQKKLLDFKTKAKQKGLDFTINSGYRSNKKQAAMRKAWDSGNQKLIKKYNIAARPAKAGYSYHNFGYAVDIKATKGTLSQLGKLAESMGWTWGGRFNDPVHIDLRKQLNGETLASLRKKEGLPS